MPTPTAQNELRRNAILIQLEAAAPATLPPETLHQGLRLAGHNLTPAALDKDLAYLADKNLLTSQQPTLARSTRRYRLTATGRDYLESQGLA